MTVTGEVPRGRAVTRSGASPGDRLVVTGRLGAAAGGLLVARQHHRDAGTEWGRELLAALSRPVARVGEGQTLAQFGATAMIDVSDGLVADLGHIADESGVGFALDEVPVAPGATLDQALTGGEDYELLFTAPARQLPVGFRIGVCTADPAERTLAGHPLPAAGGWEHRF